MITKLAIFVYIALIICQRHVLESPAMTTGGYTTVEAVTGHGMVTWLVNL
jgi:hypothetical protein